MSERVRSLATLAAIATTCAAVWVLLQKIHTSALADYARSVRYARTAEGNLVPVIVLGANTFDPAALIPPKPRELPQDARNADLMI